ncbi:hypothetical protein HJG60_007845 [Phyllostomus discolor]|uniref:Uncharacterized protein n=1 Tax=Phyllostomus discolor TaxID=89673 RepID=A0A834BKN6_9CHIR|nr:hypothetical protein HJG60_007845 [Phyllostomus discolor]
MLYVGMVAPFSWDLSPFSGILGLALCPGPQSPPHWVHQLPLAYSGSTHCDLVRPRCLTRSRLPYAPNSPSSRRRDPVPGFLSPPLPPVWMNGLLQLLGCPTSIQINSLSVLGVILPLNCCCSNLGRGSTYASILLEVLACWVFILLLLSLQLVLEPMTKWLLNLGTCLLKEGFYINLLFRHLPLAH